MDELLNAARKLLSDGAEYIIVQVIHKEPSGSSKKMQIIVDNKKEECEHGVASSSDKGCRPSSPSS